MNKKVEEALDMIEWQLYQINARNISMRWIGLREKPTDEEISELNALLSYITLEIRTLKETGEMDPKALHRKKFPKLYDDGKEDSK